MLNLNKHPALLQKNIRHLTKRKHPAFLLCGEPSVGKRTFLKNAGLHQIEEIPTDADGVELINTDCAVFIIIDETQALEFYWPFIENKISKVLWVVNAPQMIKQHSLRKFTQFFDSISTSIDIVLCSLDGLSGFFDFFSHLSVMEMEKPMGFSLLKHKHPELEFLNMLYQPLLKKLHDERSPEKRRLIREFPIEVELCTQHLLNEIKSLRRRKQIDGLFFISNNPAKKPDQFQPPYFVKNILPIILSPEKNKITQKLAYFRWLALPLTPVAIFVAVFFIHQAFHVNENALTRAQKIFDTPSNGDPFLSQLNKLYLIHEDLSDTFKWPVSMGFNQALILQRQSGLSYETLLQTDFKSLVMETLKKSISDNLNRNRLDLYNALSAYLMLTTENHFDSKAVQQWFTLFWRKEYPNDPKIQTLLHSHLQNLLAQFQNPYHQDKALVLEARSFLSTLSPPEMAFLRLQNNYAKEEVSPLGENQTIPGVNLNNASIPVFYDTENFQKIYHKDIPNLIDALNDSNWVLGINNKIELNDAQKTGLVDAVRKIYLDNFSQQWAYVLNHIQLETPKNLPEAQRNLHLLTDEKSPLTALLKAIVENINLSNNSTVAKNEALNAAIMSLVNHEGKAENLVNNLIAFEKALTTVTQSKEPNEASFQLANAYFTNPQENNLVEISKEAAALPDPIKSWISAITKPSMLMVMNNAKAYINSAWQKELLPFYQQKLLNQFPLFPEATSDTSFEDFKKFFGPKGIIDGFFTKYLQNFVDIQSQYWTFKKLDGQAFPIDQKKLNMIIRASLIQQMFFTNNPDKLGFHFYLTPISINPSLRSVAINIDGQQYLFTRQSHEIVKFDWPNSKKSIASITFTPKRLKTQDEESTPTTFTQNGPWAWLRLINTGSLRPGDSAQVFTLSFTNDNKRIRFKMGTDNVINPYLPNVLTKFRCPDDLL